ncbi:MAG: hypothetical protein U0350_28535 [Caldilineaceae bacterium]
MMDVRGEGPVFSAYRSYLVRFWQSQDQGGWRASAQSVQNGHIVLFGDIDHLLAFLQAEIGAQPERSAESVEQR